MKRTMIALAASSLLLFFVLAAAASETYVPPPETFKPARVTVLSVYQQKCSKCHPLSKPDGVTMSLDEWRQTIGEMRKRDTNWLSAADVDSIARFLAGRGLFSAKCAKCHTLDRANVQKTVEQWQTSVDRMQSKDPKWIGDAEKKLILFYLTDVNLLELE